MIQVNNKKPQNTREQHIEEVLINLEKDLTNFQLSLQTKDKTIKEYVRLLNLTKTEYQNFFNEDRQSKEKMILLEKEKKHYKWQKRKSNKKKDNIKKNQTTKVNQKQWRKK